MNRCFQEADRLEKIENEEKPTIIQILILNSKQPFLKNPEKNISHTEIQPFPLQLNG